MPFLQKLWNDGAVMRYVGYPQGLGIDEQGIQKWFEGLQSRRGVNCEHWVIENAEGEPVGEAYYKAESEYCGYQAEKMAQIDIKLARCFWGQGYASDALRTVIHYLFAKGFARIVVSPNLANEAALKLYRRLGFKPKLRFRSKDTGEEHGVWVLENSNAVEPS